LGVWRNLVIANRVKLPRVATFIADVKLAIRERGDRAGPTSLRDLLVKAG
jgi:hypothetical protein